MGDFSPYEPAIIRRAEDGTREVMSAGQYILVSTEVLDAPELDPDFIQPDGILHLDTAGQYRYRRMYQYDRDTIAYERISPETE